MAWSAVSLVGVRLFGRKRTAATPSPPEPARARRPGVARLEAHVLALCEEYGIEIEGRSDRGRALRYRGGHLAVRLPEVRGQVTYLICLHEIGHLVGRGRSAPRLEAEANAWIWALENTAVDPTTASLRSIARRLDGYLEWALARQHRRTPPRIPPRDHPFWSLRRLGVEEDAA